MTDYPKEANQLSKHERKKLLREERRREEKRQSVVKKVKTWTIGITAIAALVIGGYFVRTSREVLPPTDISGHVEQNPPAHVMNEPMPISIQKHMLEHADGDGSPGVVINYNCEDFECEPGLVGKLAEIANQYPEFVYIAPYPAMTKKLAITRLGKIQTFDVLDKEALMRFIQEK